MNEAAMWSAPSAIVAGVTTRTAGYSQGIYQSNNLSLNVGDAAVHVDANRQQLFDALGGDLSWSWLSQVHGVEVLQLPHAGELIADAAFTLQPNQVCSVMTADCLPILLTDKKSQFVAAIHAGWRSLSAGIVEKTLASIAQALLAENQVLDTSQILAWMGPAISSAHFEVGEDVHEAFLADAPEKSREAFIVKRKGKYHADIFQLGKIRLNLLGVEHIFCDHECTFSQPARFYSYRRDGQTGRMVSYIYKREPAADFLIS